MTSLGTNTLEHLIVLSINGTIMKKFVIQSKSGQFSIQEVEVEVILATEDPSVAWLPAGEYKARIMKPTSFHMKIEKLINNKREMVDVPDVWYNFAFSDSLEDAKATCAELIREEFKFKQRKHKIDFTEQDVADAQAKMQVVLLPV